MLELVGQMDQLVYFNKYIQGCYRRAASLFCLEVNSIGRPATTESLHPPSEEPRGCMAVEQGSQTGGLTVVAELRYP